MTRRFSLIIAWGCTAVLVLAPLTAFYLLINIDSFATLARKTLDLAIQWETVTTTQWYGLWLLSAAYLAIVLGGLYFLRRAFTNFAKGEMFTLDNSLSIRRFSKLLMLQTIANPLHIAISSVLLSWNHPAGHQILTFTLGSYNIKTISLAMILWVISELLVKGNELENENKQFI